MQQDMFDVEKGHVGVDFFPHLLPAMFGCSNLHMLQSLSNGVTVKAESKVITFAALLPAVLCVCLAPGGANKSATN